MGVGTTERNTACHNDFFQKNANKKRRMMKDNAKEIIQKDITEVIPYDKNPRKNDKAVDKVANSIRSFGFQSPIIIDEHNVIICGHTRFKAAKKLGLKKVPCIVATGLADAEIRAYRIADNKVGELAEWDNELLASELELCEMNMEDFGIENITTAEDDCDEVDIKSAFEVIVECKNEAEQKSVFDEMTKKGFVCRVLTL